MIRALRILLAGYGVAAGSAIAVYAAGYSLFPAILTFWIGGAVAVCVIAVIGTPYWSAEAEVEEAEATETLQEALRRWEEDRLEDRALPVRRTGTDSP
jgi:hypothetical protein